jgi:NAD(P)-dependent dehydrogenase (short-subunit alcohol dehydrogenase family)
VNDTTHERIAVVTGASAGIGKATAAALLQVGWTVIGTGRDPARTAAALLDLQAAAQAGGGAVHMLRGDFCEMADVKRVAGEIAALTGRINVLINNAGGVRDKLYMSSEGVEATFAANHLAPFLLTRELMPILKATAADSPPRTVRVIAVSSLAHHICAGMRWEDLNMLEDYNANPAYCQAKLANILFARELDRRAGADGIASQAMHPGRVDSNFAGHGDANMQSYFAENGGDAPEQPARTLVWMATALEAGLPGGRYFFDCAEAPMAPQAQDDEAAARLWQASEDMLAKIAV